MGLVGISPWYRYPSAEEKARIPKVLEQVGMRRYAERAFAELSGGQRQRTCMKPGLIRIGSKRRWLTK
jgi:ABC-type Mn2+/Zn2+ transport system ATPase subunit